MRLTLLMGKATKCTVHRSLLSLLPTSISDQKLHSRVWRHKSGRPKSWISWEISTPSSPWDQNGWIWRCWESWWCYSGASLIMSERQIAWLEKGKYCTFTFKMRRTIQCTTGQSVSFQTLGRSRSRNPFLGLWRRKRQLGRVSMNLPKVNQTWTIWLDIQWGEGHGCCLSCLQ